MRLVEVVQNKALRNCTGKIVSSPINVLKSEATEPPLELRSRFLSMQYFIKLLPFDFHSSKI